MASSTLVLRVTIGLLMVVSLIETAFISYMVSWLHRRAGGDFGVKFNAGQFPLHGKPEHLLLNQGHTSNGAAGTAFVLIGLGGFITLWLRDRASRSSSKSFCYRFWLTMTIPALLLTMAALIYTFIITKDHSEHTIDVVVAARLNNKPYPYQEPYPLNMWTPENWFKAVLKLPLAYDSERSDIGSHLRIIKGWRWNLIPLFIVQLAVCVAAFWDFLQIRRSQPRSQQVVRKSISSS